MHLVHLLLLLLDCEGRKIKKVLHVELACWIGVVLVGCCSGCNGGAHQNCVVEHFVNVLLVLLLMVLLLIPMVTESSKQKKKKGGLVDMLWTSKILGCGFETYVFCFLYMIGEAML